jgi:hypothetical protein
MYILRPNGRRRLDEQILEVCGNHDGIERRYALVLCAGAVDPENLEPFATLDRILQNTVDRELRLVVTDQWPERFWTTEVAGALDVADLEGTFELNPTLDQRRRALQQRVGDGRLEVLFIERGQVRGSALTIVAPTRGDGRPLPLNTKVAALDLLQAARDSLPWRPRPLEQLVRDAREALGIPAGAVTSIATIRRGGRPDRRSPRGPRPAAGGRRGARRRRRARCRRRAPRARGGWSRCSSPRPPESRAPPARRGRAAPAAAAATAANPSSPAADRARRPSC